MREAGIIAIWLALVSTLAFVSEYTWLAPWWTDEISATIVIKDTILISLFIMTLLQIAFPLSTVLMFTSLVLIYAITPIMIWRMHAFWVRRTSAEHRLPARIRRRRASRTRPE